MNNNNNNINNEMEAFVMTNDQIDTVNHDDDLSYDDAKMDSKPPTSPTPIKMPQPSYGTAGTTPRSFDFNLPQQQKQRQKSQQLMQNAMVKKKLSKLEKKRKQINEVSSINLFCFVETKATKFFLTHLPHSFCTNTNTKYSIL